MFWCFSSSLRLCSFLFLFYVLYIICVCVYSPPSVVVWSAYGQAGDGWRSRSETRALSANRNREGDGHRHASLEESRVAGTGWGGGSERERERELKMDSDGREGGWRERGGRERGKVEREKGWRERVRERGGVKREMDCGLYGQPHQRLCGQSETAPPTNYNPLRTCLAPRKRPHREAPWPCPWLYRVISATWIFDDAYAITVTGRLLQEWISPAFYH